jgi:hypothetical protein
MRPALDPAGHRVPQTKPTCLLHTRRPHQQRTFALVLHLHQHESSRNLHLQYVAKNQSAQRCQSLITQGSDHPPVLEPHMVLTISTRFGRPFAPVGRHVFMHFAPSICTILTMSSSRPRLRFSLHEVRSFTLQSSGMFLHNTLVLASIGSDFIKLINTNKTP